MIAVYQEHRTEANQGPPYRSDSLSTTPYGGLPLSGISKFLHLDSCQPASFHHPLLPLLANFQILCPGCC